jgi:hypothetical protein
MVQEHNVDVRMRREFAPPISAEGDDRELPAVGDVACLGAEFLFDRRAAYAFDQQVYNQTPRLNYLLPPYSEPVAQAQSLCLYFQELFERGESLRRIRLVLDLTQFLACVTLNCDQVNLHLVCAACAEVEQAGRQRGEGNGGTPQGLCLLAFATFRLFRWAIMKIGLT